MNIITFDTEEWYNYAQFGDQKGNFIPEIDHVQGTLLDTLDEFNIQATFFVLGIVARQYPYVVKNIYKRGHDIGCHSDCHRKLWELNSTQMQSDTRIAIDSIEQLTGEKVKSYRAPAFSLCEKNAYYIEILSANGIETDCSIFPGVRDYGGFPDFSENAPCVLSYNGIKLKELPMNLTSVFGKKIAYSGGGYFRLLPYAFIKYIMDKNIYNMMYLHVHDFYGEQKRIISPRYFKNYYGNRTSLAKLKKIFRNFDFVNVKQAVSSIQWENIKLINLY